MAKLMILYRHLAEPPAFEDYYASRQIPYAAGHMPQRARRREHAGCSQHLTAARHLTTGGADELSQRGPGAGITSDGGRSIVGTTNFATRGATLLIVDEDE